jgi:hypothetical protein
MQRLIPEEGNLSGTKIFTFARTRTERPLLFAHCRELASI